ncbi:hypothetical protein ACPRNU_19980 [Chromobacterium vaccinii]
MSRRRVWPAVLLAVAAAGGGAWRLWPAATPPAPPATAKPAAAPPTRPIAPIADQATPITAWRPPARPALPPVKKGGNSWRRDAAPVITKAEVQRGAPDIPGAQALPRPPDP